METTFDQIVGAIEDIVIDDQFQDLQTELLEKHFHHFDVSTENIARIANAVQVTIWL